MMEKRKGISTFIATLLLMVLAVSAGVVIYAYTMGYMGGFGGTDMLGALSLDQATMSEGTAIDGTISAYIRNIGKTDIKIIDAYVAGEQANVTDGPNLYVEIDQGEVEEVTINEDSITASGHVAWTIGKTYDVKLICEDNTQITFSVKCES
jgi:hypothetical protein